MDEAAFYWDTSVFLCFLNSEESDRRLICEDILQNAQEGKVRIYTSTFTIAEVIRPKSKSIPNSRRLSAVEVEKIRSMFKWPFITLIELDERTAQLAVEIARDYAMLPADAVHAASAISWTKWVNIDQLQAWDRDFSAISKLIDATRPSFITRQPILDGIDPMTPIGPTPDDFDLPSKNEPDKI